MSRTTLHRIPRAQRKAGVGQRTEKGRGPIERNLPGDGPDREGEAIAWHVMEAAEMGSGASSASSSGNHAAGYSGGVEQPRAIDMDRVEAQQWHGAFWTGWWAISLAPCCGARFTAACRLVGCNRSLFAWWSSASADRCVTSVEYWTIDAELSQPKFRIDPRGNGKPSPLLPRPITSH